MDRLPYDTSLDAYGDEPPEPRPERDPDEARDQAFDDALHFPDDDYDDGYEPVPRIRACIDRTGGRFREPF